MKIQYGVYSEKSKTPKSPEGDFEEFIDFQRIPLQGSGVKKLKINELRLFGVDSILEGKRAQEDCFVWWKSGPGEQKSVTEVTAPVYRNTLLTEKKPIRNFKQGSSSEAYTKRLIQ